MIVRIGHEYEDDWDFEDHEEGEMFTVDRNAVAVTFQILNDPDDEDAVDDREGTLSAQFSYELHDGQLCAIVDGKYIPCEDDCEFEQMM